MLTCTAVRERISAFLDGELSAERAEAVRGHLATCAQCAAWHAELAATDRLLDRAGAIAPADDFTAAVLARVRARRAESAAARLRRAIARPWPRWAVAASLAAAIAIGSGAAWLTGPGAPPPSETAVIARQFGLEAFEDLPAGSVEGAVVDVACALGGEGR